MNRALLFLTVRSLANRARRKLGRLRTPRYAIAFALGAAFLWVFLIRQPAYSVFGRKERDELNARSLVQHVNRLSPGAVAPRVICDQSDAHPCKLFEPIALEDVDARQDRSIVGRIKRRRHVRSARQARHSGQDFSRELRIFPARLRDGRIRD